LPNNRLLDQFLPEYSPLVGPLEALFHDHTARPDAEGRDHPALVVEVRHDDFEALVLDAQEVLDGDFNVVKLDERGAGRRRIAGLNLGRLEPFLSLDQQHGEATLGFDARDEIVAEVAVGDPFLGP
jgi:hypothetical protein